LIAREFLDGFTTEYTVVWQTTTLVRCRDLTNHQPLMNRTDIFL